MIPLTRCHEFPKIELGKNVQTFEQERVGWGTEVLAVVEEADQQADRCALDKLWKLEWLAARLVIELLDEIEFPTTTTDLPCTEGKCKEGDETDD